MTSTQAMKNIKAITLCVALVATATLAQAQGVKGDAKAGEKKNAMCIGCHGIEGYQASFPQIYRVPKISGQSGKYIAAALEGYRKGDRLHPSMRAIAGSLTDQDIADLAAYYEADGKDAAATAPAQAEIPAHLKERLAVCVTCHGTNFNNTTDPANPRLAGQYADYLTVSLRAYQTEGKHMVGRANATMGAMAKPLKDSEVEQIAKFLSGLPGELKTVSHAKFR
ncbi:MAG TPA: c-type cytochrome [Ideonella sp.]|uniref:c-type cytochrome n=1 Tax=Ideonella sp. TaxID=1929293 RepID=UPI002E30C90A|nr:c-type cytochrome [Ideonella sp.]HEX5683041.1 c-type cytochrome [Ideonella sp.]